MDKLQTWYNRYDFEINMDYTEKILRKFKIENYHFITNSYGSLSLIIILGLSKYKIEILEETYENIETKKIEDRYAMVVKRCENRLMAKKHTKEYMPIKKKFYRDCIYDSIKWVRNDCRTLSPST